MELTLLAVIAIALFFDFTNGFHDTANSIATSVSTRALSPRVAVISAAILNFLGAFVSFEVAATIAKGIVDQEIITLEIVLAGLVGAITWNLVTWYVGLPSSSSHALIGGMVGSAAAAQGFDVVQWNGLREKVLIPSLLAPTLGVFVAAALMVLVLWVIRHRAPGVVNRVFRRFQLVSGAFVAFTHGTNDAQKTMGIMALALVASGHLAPDFERPPLWVIVSAATAMGLGTYAGGLADHQDARDPRREAGAAAGLRRADGLREHPLDHRALRLPGLDDARDQRLGARCRSLDPPLGRPLGRRRKHPARLGADDPVCGSRRRGDAAPDALAGRRRPRRGAHRRDRGDRIPGAERPGAAAASPSGADLRSRPGEREEIRVQPLNVN